MTCDRHGSDAASRHEVAGIECGWNKRLVLVGRIPVSEGKDDGIVDIQLGAAAGHKLDMAMLAEPGHTGKAEVSRRGTGIAVEAGGHTEICNARCERTVRAVDLGRKRHR